MSGLERQMTEHPRILSEGTIRALESDVFAQALAENQIPEGINHDDVATFIHNGIVLMQDLEKAAVPHPTIHPDTDVIYHDTGPGPIVGLSKGLVLEDFNYHSMHYTQKMDRARFNVGKKIAEVVTYERRMAETGEIGPLSIRDYEKYSPYFMYTSAEWQNKHARQIIEEQRPKGQFNVPEDKIVMYDTFTNSRGETKKIVHTGDQVEGLTFPKNNDGRNPRRILMVSHPAHLVRILHYLEKCPEKIPEDSILQLFPLPTPSGEGYDATIEYAKAELIGTIKAIYTFGNAGLTPFQNYQI